MVGQSADAALRRAHDTLQLILDHAPIGIWLQDGFKAMNDTHGHAMGDRLLAILAQRMQAALREGDTVGDQDTRQRRHDALRRVGCGLASWQPDASWTATYAELV